MIGVRCHLAALLLVILLTAYGAGAAAECQPQTAEFSAMKQAELVILRAAGGDLRIATRIADEASERAAGYQHICPRTIEDSTILFLFARPVRTAFHMHNVHAPLDIAFIGDDGRIREVLRMQPYQLAARTHPVYQPQQAFIAALEAPAGFFAGNEVAVGDRLVMPH